jgi:hypothetical protein
MVDLIVDLLDLVSNFNEFLISHVVEGLMSVPDDSEGYLEGYLEVDHQAMKGVLGKQQCVVGRLIGLEEQAFGQLVDRPSKIIKDHAQGSEVGASVLLDEEVSLLAKNHEQKKS